MREGKALDHGYERVEILAASKQPAVVTKTVSAKLEAAQEKSVNHTPVDWILRQRKVPGRAKSMEFLNFGHPLHSLESKCAIHIVREHDAAFLCFRPKADVPGIGLADRRQIFAKPLPPEIHQYGF